MTARVRVDGVWLDSIATVANVVDSTIFRHEGYSGDYEASCEWLIPPDYSGSQLRRGALFEVVEHGHRTWGGWLAEPEVGETTSLHAYGFGAMAEDWPALASGPVPTSVANTAIDYAIAEDLPWKRFDSISSVAVGGADGEMVTLATLLDRVAKRAGKHWWVDSFGEVSLASEPTSLAWTLTPGAGYMGTADDQYVTHLYGYYVSSVDGVTGEPDGWSIVEASDDAMAAKFGRKSATVDLTSLGLMSAVTAQADVDGRFALVGARMGWTNGIDLSGMNLRKPGWGAASPLSVRAGQRLRIPGVRDTRSTPTTRASVDVTLGQVTRVHSEGRAFALPVGFVSRDFQAAFAVKRPDQVVAA